NQVSTIRFSLLTGTYSYAALYQFSLSSPATVTVDMRSAAFDDYLYLLSPTGTVLFSDDNSGGNTDARITATLAAGTYLIEATSARSLATGDYALSINLPTIASIAPVFLEQGATVPVTLTGNRFATPMTIAAGSGISVSNVAVPIPATATATFAVSSAAAT